MPGFLGVVGSIYSEFTGFGYDFREAVRKSVEAVASVGLEGAAEHLKPMLSSDEGVDNGFPLETKVYNPHETRHASRVNALLTATFLMEPGRAPFQT
jgi:hypothetical protein